MPFDDPQLLTGLGAAASVFLAAMGSAWASAQAGIFAVNGKDYKAFIPIVQAGVLSIYGLIVAILMAGRMWSTAASMSQADGYRYLCAGLANGLACWASGWGMAKFIKLLNAKHDAQMTAPTMATTTATSSSPAMEPLLGKAASAPVNDYNQELKSFRKTILAMIFLEAIGLYGLIVALVLIGKK